MKPRYLCLLAVVLGLFLLIFPATKAVAGTKNTIAGGGSHTLAIQRDGSLWAWGYNMHGELGVGDTNWRLIPTLVGSGFVATASGMHITDSFSLGLKADGTLWAWGSNDSGQLGLGYVGDQNSPIQVGTGYVAVAAGAYHSLGLKADGTLWAWGYNADGELGLGNTTQQNYPQQVGTGFVAIAAGYSHNLGLKPDGSLWAWGYNDSGQLGTGNTTQQLYPTAVGTLGLVALAAGGNYSLGFKVDGSLWAWGSNYYGQLGLGDNSDRLSPTQVPRFNAPRAAVIPLF